MPDDRYLDGDPNAPENPMDDLTLFAYREVSAIVDALDTKNYPAALKTALSLKITLLGIAKDRELPLPFPQEI